MNKFKEGWFTELSPMWDGEAFSLKVDKVLYEGSSKYQHLLLLDTSRYGKTLVLDGAIQCTEKDEFSYQEMITFLPLTSHPNPKSVLIIGGGDGGVAREVSKYPTVERIVQCEIDEKVVEMSKTWLPHMAVGFSSPKLELVIGDGFAFMGEHEDEFDVIITDSSDPIGPAESLFGEKYYGLCNRALREGGIVCSQGESAWYHIHIIKEMVAFCKKIFPVVRYAYTCMPTYPGGQLGFLLCSKSRGNPLDKPHRVLSNTEQDAMRLRYYSPEMHRASFVLPRFAAKEIYTEDSD